MDIERTGKGKGSLRLVHAGKQVETYLRRRHQELIASGELPARGGLPDDVKREELGNFLDQFIQNQIAAMGGANTEEEITQAAMEMGLQGEVPSYEGPSDV
ncbi:hypothetical protein PC116_g30469 [Phytophthora cactorum]|nr:hypothetical protein PC116_g30469 [Phytophthora cactorum]